jgi:hypothetical protein
MQQKVLPKLGGRIDYVLAIVQNEEQGLLA